MSSVNHNDLAGIGINDHHAQAHTLASHSTKAHAELTGVNPSDHHAKTTSIAELTDHNKANHDALGLDHASLSNVLTSQHHVKTVSADILLASMGEKNHASLSNVLTDQHHAKLHAATHGLGGADQLKVTDLAGNTAWRLFYAGAGTPPVITELALGASGQRLTSQGAGSAPIWQTPTVYIGGSGSVSYIPKFSAAATLANSAFTESDLQALFGYGSSTYRIYFPCIPMFDAHNATSKIVRSATSVAMSNVGATDGWAQFQLVAPTNRGGKTLHIDRIRFDVADADASDYITQHRVFALKGAGTYDTVHDSPTNYTTAGVRTIAFVEYTCTSVYAVVAGFNCVFTTAGEMDIGNVAIGGWYE